MLNLCDVLQECNPAVKQDLSTLLTSSPPPPAASNTVANAAAANNLQHTHIQQNVVLWSKF